MMDGRSRHRDCPGSVVDVGGEMAPYYSSKEDLECPFCSCFEARFFCVTQHSSCLSVSEITGLHLHVRWEKLLSYGLRGPKVPTSCWKFTPGLGVFSWGQVYLKELMSCGTGIPQSSDGSCCCGKHSPFLSGFPPALIAIDCCLL